MKVRITYAPQGADPQSWEFDPEDADNLEAEAIELVGDTTWDSYAQWLFLMGRGNMRAIRALLWILQLRTNPDLDFNEVRFRTADIAVESLDEPELAGKDEVGDSNTGSPPPVTDSAA